MTLRFSAGLPNCREGRLSPVGSVTIDGMQHVARVADELGYHSLWPNEIFTGRADVSERYTSLPSLFDCIVTMSYAAAVTKSIRLCSSTIVLPLHEPIVLSRQIATLDQFSGGRVILGIGLGGKAEEYKALHSNHEGVHRGNMMDEYIEALRLLWTKGSHTYKGTYAAFTDIESHTLPAQDPLPIYVAGPSEGVLKRVATYGQGWIVSRIGPDAVRANVERLYELAAEAGRAQERFEVARQFYVSIGRTQEEAEANYRAAMPGASASAPPTPTGSGGPKRKDPGEYSIIGTPESISERIRTYQAAGVTEFAMIFYYPTPEAGEEQLRLFAEEVIPAFS